MAIKFCTALSSLLEHNFLLCRIQRRMMLVYNAEYKTFVSWSYFFRDEKDKLHSFGCKWIVIFSSGYIGNVFTPMGRNGNDL